MNQRMNLRWNFQRRESLIGFMFVLPALIGIGGLFVVPFVESIYLSLTSSISASGQTGIHNYLEMLQNRTFQLAFVNTFRFILVSVPLIMAFSLTIAMLLHKKLKGSQFFSSVFIFPLILPIVTVIMFFEIIFDIHGFINQMLIGLGLPVVDWLNSSASFATLVIIYIWKNCGYNIVLFLAALNSIPSEVNEAYSLDSRNVFKRIYYVTLPLISPYLFFILCLSIINTFRSFREAYILAGSHPHTSIYMVQHFISNNIRNMNYPRLAVATIIVFVAMIIPIFFAFTYRVRRQAGEL
jgi:multiple sugar transport system permease protein